MKPYYLLAAALVTTSLLSVSCNKKAISSELSYFGFRDLGEDKIGIVDENGNVVLDNCPELYPSIQGGVFATMNNQEVFSLYRLDKPSKPIVEACRDFLPFRDDYTCILDMDNEIKVIDKHGKIMCVVPEQYDEVCSFAGGHCILLDYGAGNGFCMMDSKGNISKDDDFFYLNTFPGGMILGAADADDGSGVVFLCDADRKNMTTLCKMKEFQCLYLTPDLKYVALKENVSGKCGLYSVETGEPVIKPKYDELVFEDEECIFFKSQNVWGVTNVRNEVVIKAKFSNPGAYHKGHIILTDSRRRMGMLNLKGETLLPFEYKTILPIRGGDNLIASRIGNDFVSIIDTLGNTVNNADFRMIAEDDNTASVSEIIGRFYAFSLVKEDSIKRNNIK